MSLSDYELPYKRRTELTDLTEFVKECEEAIEREEQATTDAKRKDDPPKKCVVAVDE